MSTFEGYLYNLQDMPDDVSTSAVCLEHGHAEEGTEERLILLSNAGTILFAPPIPGIPPDEVSDTTEFDTLKQAYDLYATARMLQREREDTLRMLTEVKQAFDELITSLKASVQVLEEEGESHPQLNNEPLSESGDSASDGTPAAE